MRLRFEIWYDFKQLQRFLKIEGEIKKELLTAKYFNLRG